MQVSNEWPKRGGAAPASTSNNSHQHFVTACDESFSTSSGTRTHKVETAAVATEFDRLQTTLSAGAHGDQHAREQTPPDETLQRSTRILPTLPLMHSPTASEHDQYDLTQRFSNLTVDQGFIVPLRTKAEVQASSETTSAYIVEIPNKSGNGLVNVLREVVPNEVTTSLQHLRRFAKPDFLPAHLQPRRTFFSRFTNTARPTRNGKPATSHLLISPTSTVTKDVLEALLKKNKGLFHPLVPTIRQAEVPVHAPTSAAQAEEWGRKYWPTIYKNTNPYGPHPSMVTRAELELLKDGDADKYMALAKSVARATASSRCGVAVGAVVVGRVDLEGTRASRVVAVAGDSRYVGIAGNEGGNNKSSAGSTDAPPDNVMAHAAIRAISMVAQKRRLLAQRPGTAPRSDENGETQPVTDKSDAGPFASTPQNDVERTYLSSNDALQPDGYLCLDLELYLTHEPCVMCAMAILHSRFSRVVFANRMSKSGALCSEPDSLEHGLFWRDYLNWRFLVWQWLPLPREDQKGQEEDDEMPCFNA